MCALSTGVVGVTSRKLSGQALCGPIPASIGALVNLKDLCVRPASPRNVGSAEGGSLGG